MLHGILFLKSQSSFSLGEISLRLMADCLQAEGWQDSQSVSEIGYQFKLFVLQAEYEDGSTVTHSGVFDRAHIPEKEFLLFVDALEIIIRSYGFGGIIEMEGFMSALKKGEVKYCGVEFTKHSKVYHYRTTDLRINVGDEVIVPVGENDFERVAVVTTVEFCRWDDTPYPLEETKEILRLASDEEFIPSLPRLSWGVKGGMDENPS